MIEVHDNNEHLTFNDIISYFGTELDGCRWEVFDLEYSGDDFRGELPITIEKKTEKGLSFSPEEFSLFASTINQVIEGTIILRSSSLNIIPHKDEKDAVIKILINDGSVWEVGGKKAEKFIKAMGLIPISGQT